MNEGRIYTELDDPAAWTGDDMRKSTDWLTHVDDQAIADMEAALAGVRLRRLALPDIGRDDFPLPSMAATLAKIAHALEHGTGFALVRGLPVQRWGFDDATIIYWGLSTHLGRPVSQDRSGKLMEEVRNLGASPKPELDIRGPQTSAELFFHADFADIVGLLCLHPARSGGVSRICSALAIYNALVRAGRRDLIDALYDGYFLDRKGEQGPQLPPVSEHPVPMLSWHRERLSFRFTPGWVKAAVRRTGRTWSPIQQEAFDEVCRLSNRPEFVLDMDFQTGDVQFLNNYAVLHSRTAFVDHDEPERKRFLQRIWLRSRIGHELAEDFDHLFGPASTRDGIPQVFEDAA